MVVALLGTSVVQASPLDAQHSFQSNVEGLSLQSGGTHGGHGLFAVPSSFEGIGSIEAGALGLLEVDEDGTFGGITVWQGRPGVPGLDEDGDRFGGALAWGDLDGNGVSDLIVGSPLEDVGPLTDAGAITVLYDAATRDFSRAQLFHQGSPGVAGANEADDLWGHSIAAGDVNGDGFDDLMVGAPGEDIGTIADAGAVTLLFGGPTGLTGTDSQLYHQGSPGMPGVNEAGDQLGFSVAITGGVSGITMTAAAGAPGEDISGVSNTGAVTVFKTERDGGLLPQPPLLFLGASESGVRPDIAFGLQPDGLFGYTLEADPSSIAMLIASPFVDIGGVVDSGLVIIYQPSAPTPLAGNLFLTDFGPGARYGFSVDLKQTPSNRFLITSGVPGATVNGQVDAGAISVFSPAGNFVFTQDDVNIPGVAEAEDQFGYYVDGLDDGTIFASAPGEDIGLRSNVGAATVLFTTGLNDEPGNVSAFTIHQDTPGVAGVGEFGDQWGS